MKFYIQYNKLDGQIFGAVQSDRRPPVDEDDPQRGQIEFDKPFDYIGQRVNLDTLEMEACPLFAKEKHNGEILLKLRELDAKTPRAHREFLLTGSTTRLQEIEDAADELRAQYIK